ncbi:MAG: energy-coupling factor transporter transmembrane protein EcfT [Treponema sp.]|jgi:energy-coupling factor transport system permease protein|nr:energy-coupling factor transporter transmembrane protein EcfT [Treponema sp.]
MTGLLDYAPGNSALHRLHPLTKLVLSFVFCAVCFITENPLLPLSVLLITLGLDALAGVAGRGLRILLSLGKFSLFLFAVQALFVRDGRALLTLPLGIVITDRGLLFSLLFVLRLLAAAMPLALLFSVTRMNDIANVLVRNAGIPYKYAFVLTTAMRFIPLFAQEMAGIIEAQIARGVEFDTRNFFKKVKLLLPLCVPLLISSVRRIEGGAISAELRGFNLRTRYSGCKRYAFTGGDALACFTGALLIAAALLV